MCEDAGLEDLLAVLAALECGVYTKFLGEHEIESDVVLEDVLSLPCPSC